MMPLYVLLILTKYNNLFNFLLSEDSMVVLFSFVFVTAVFIPLVCYVFVRKSKFYSVTNHEKYHWTSFFLLIEALIYCAIYKSLMRVGIPLLISKFFILNSLIIVILGLIALFVEMDFHSIALGEILGLYIRLLHIGLASDVILLTVILLLVGIVGTSRIFLNEHLSTQYYLGVLSGFALIFFLFI